MHTIHELHMCDRLGLAEACVLHVLHVYGVEPLLYTMHTVCIRVALVA